MKWSNVMRKVDSITVEALKRFLDTNSASSYILIDVRQPAEYAKGHIPGAVSMPLNDLVNGSLVLPEPKPLFIYSRMGGRSRAAAQWFVSQDHHEVRELEGGFEAWNGSKAFGRSELNLGIVQQDIEFSDAISLAYAMEEGLRKFYLEMARQTSDQFYQKLYRKLASFEVEHKQTLAKSYAIAEGKEHISKELEARQVQLMEGGGVADETLIKTLAGTSSVHDVFSLAIAFETQAFDFYIRLSRHALNDAARSFFLEMADAEKEHLAFVTRELDTYLTTKQS